MKNTISIRTNRATELRLNRSPNTSPKKKNNTHLQEAGHQPTSVATSVLPLSRSSRPRFLRSRTGTPNSVSDSPSSLDGRSNGRTRTAVTGSPLRRLAHASSLGYESDDSVVKLDRASHAAIKNDIVSVKTMLLKLRRVLNEQTNEETLLMSETRNPFENQMNGHFHGFSSETNSCSEMEEDSGKLELVDLQRQVLFLQGQLEDKEKTVQSLQEQMTKICVDNYLSNSAPASTVNNEKEMCNAATQTDRIRPLSVGPSLPNGSQAESTPGSLVSVTELSRKTRTSARMDSLQRTPTRERRKLVEFPSSPLTSRSNAIVSTSIPRRSESRTRAAPSSLT
ncbi:hypothetical protein HHI36_013657 [Cryptolaemus montrouzieri]|uniref:Uncharacterized protein n=1 Tax=Cryptolaemus montrouzieri TaxID=559131 RepID=A0ABD2NHZ8_9CUCU